MQTMGELLERNARFFPQREALICEGRRLTYAELAVRARQVADGLYQLGMRRQDRVAILAMNCPEYMELFSAGDWAGYIVATVNFRMAAPEVAWLLGNADPKVLVFEAQYADLVAAIRPQLPGIESYVCIDGPRPAGWALDFEAVLASGAVEGPPIRARADDFGPLIYTSGTTGRPKGALRSQWRWTVTAESVAFNAEMGADCRVLLTTPAFHIGVLGYAQAALWRGGTVVLQRGFDARRVLQTFQEERITFTFMVPTMLQAVLDVADVERFDVSSVRRIMAAAAPVPVPLLKRGIALFGAIFSVQYGSTETSGTVLAQRDVNPYGDERALARLGSVGYPPPRSSVKVVDEAGIDCAQGEPGEVLVFTDGRFDGYWNNTIATLETLKDGWVHTGDMGLLDEDGCLYLVDRKKDMIISGGENIYSREVENALLEHAAVQDCAVIGVPDAKWGEAVKAYVMFRPGHSASEVQLIAHCKGLIASYKCPKSIERLADLPRVTSGKTDKVALRQLASSAS